MQKITAFQEMVYAETKKIPCGKVSTYAAIARRIGRPGSARAVGNALHKNPFAPSVPCHRVVKSDGGLGGFASGQKEKVIILEKEKIGVVNKKIVDFKKRLYENKKENKNFSK